MQCIVPHPSDPVHIAPSQGNLPQFPRAQFSLLFSTLSWHLHDSTYHTFQWFMCTSFSSTNLSTVQTPRRWEKKETLYLNHLYNASTYHRAWFRADTPRLFVKSKSQWTNKCSAATPVWVRQEIREVLSLLGLGKPRCITMAVPSPDEAGYLISQRNTRKT